MSLAISSGSRKRCPVPIAAWMPEEALRLFIEPEEVDVYKAAHPKAEIVDIGEGGRGFGYLLNAMFKEARSRGEEEVFFFDDDVTGLKQREVAGGKAVKLEGDAAMKALRQVVATRREHRCAQLALSFEGHAWGANKHYASPIGAWCAHVTSVESFFTVGGVPEDPPVFSDWILSAMLLICGYQTERDNCLSFIHKMKAMEGGAKFIYERKEFTHECARKAAALIGQYGDGLARVIFDERHGLHEVRFNWRKIAKLNG